MTPAALSALVDGNEENFKAATTPGGIEAQEAEGQAMICAQLWLPRQNDRNWEDEDGARPLLEKLGIEVVRVVNDLFYEVRLPAGWAMRATDHSMWNDVFDEKGRERIQVFYKAAFYDRSAHIRLVRRYNLMIDWDSEKEETFLSDDGTEIFRGTEGECARYIHDTYPDHKDPFAYWDEPQEGMGR